MEPANKNFKHDDIADIAAAILRDIKRQYEDTGEDLNKIQEGSITESTIEDISCVRKYPTKLKEMIEAIDGVKEVKIEDGIISIKCNKNVYDTLQSFIDKSDLQKTLFYRSDQGTFYYAGKEMVPKKTDSQYWYFFQALYEVAMDSAPDGNYYLAPYNNLKKAIIKYGYSEARRMNTKNFAEKMRKNINNQFRRRPESFGLREHKYKGRELITIEEGKGIKLHNPSL